MKRSVCNIIVFCLVCILLFTNTAFAMPDETASPAATATGDATVNFSIKAIIPDNQIDNRLTYFDLKMAPGQKQTLEVKVFNNSLTEQEFSVAVHTASTNQGGIIEYAKSVENDETLAHPLSDIAKVDTPTLKIASGKSDIAKISLTMPDEQFDGILLGGIVVAKLNEAEPASPQPTAGTAIINEYSYVLGVKLSETDAVVEPDFKLKGIMPELINYKTAVVVSLQNFQPAIVKGMNVAAKIFEQGGSAPIIEFEKNNIDVAPNSTYPCVIDWNNNAINPGTYRLQMKATLEERVWEWDETFTIDAEESATVNNNAIDINRNNTIWYWVGGGLLLLFIVCAFMMINKRRRTDG